MIDWWIDLHVSLALSRVHCSIPHIDNYIDLYVHVTPIAIIVNPTKPLAPCIETYLVSEHPYGSGSGHFIGSEPDGSESGRNTQYKDLSNGTYHLAEREIEWIVSQEWDVFLTNINYIRSA